MLIYPYKNGSKSAKALSVALGCTLLKREGKKRRTDLLINWGSSQVDRDIRCTFILNQTHAIESASNKLKTFKWFDHFDVPTVEWTTDKDDGYSWLQNGSDVVVRKVLNGHSGQGVQIVTVDQYNDNVDLPDAPLYTKYQKKKDEYRIHVFQGKVIFQQRKARDRDVPDDKVNWQVRNLAGGFIFANDNVVAPDSCLDAAIRAVNSLGLDFGAADIGYKDGNAVVYEVNTACGLMGKTLDAYVNAIKEIV